MTAIETSSTSLVEAPCGTFKSRLIHSMRVFFAQLSEWNGVRFQSYRLDKINMLLNRTLDNEDLYEIYKSYVLLVLISCSDHGFVDAEGASLKEHTSKLILFSSFFEANAHRFYASENDSFILCNFVFDWFGSRLYEKIKCFLGELEENREGFTPR